MTLQASGLSAVRAGRTILHPTDLSLAGGERVGLVGASGSGKSTLGHALVDALRADGQAVAHVAQSPDEALDPLRSMGFHWHQVERALDVADDPAHRRALFAALGIEGGDLDKRPWGWSRGMQQRFVIAMAMIGAPDLIVLDEPTSALDPIVAAGTMDLLDRHLTGSNMAMLLITHDLGLAVRHVGRIVVMANGRKVEDAPTATLLAQPRSRAARALVSHRSWASLPC
ncbi:MAG: ATP-binding cassette domain-containing protein [Pseudomonadota bacterium]